MSNSQNPAAPKPHGDLNTSSPATHPVRTRTEETPSDDGAPQPAGHPAGIPAPVRGIKSAFGDGANKLNDGPITPPESWTVTVSQAQSKGWKLTDGQNCKITYNGKLIIVYADLNSAKTTWTLTFVRAGS